MNIFHKHKWEYERHNALVIRSCNCGEVQQGIINEEPQLVTTAPVRRADFAAIKWEKV
jgi:uncharacterized protein involved in propanediol utilization